MDHMVVGLMVGIGWIKMILSNMVGSSIHLIENTMEMGFNLVIF